MNNAFMSRRCGENPLQQSVFRAKDFDSELGLRQGVTSLMHFRRLAEDAKKAQEAGCRQAN